MPCLPWRVGAAAAAVRSAAITTLTTALGRKLVGAAAAAELIAQQRLLAHLFSALGDSASPAVKTAGLAAIRLLLAAVAGGGEHGVAEGVGFKSAADGGPTSSSGANGARLACAEASIRPRGAAGGAEVTAAAGSGAADSSPRAHGDKRDGSGVPAAGLSPADWGMAAKKLSKRLEDGSDAVRVAACDALAELMRCRIVESCGGSRNSARDGNPEIVEGTGAAVAELHDKLRLHASDESPTVGAAAQSVLDVLQAG